MAVERACICHVHHDVFSTSKTLSLEPWPVFLISTSRRNSEMKNLDEALRSHIQELDNFYFGTSQSKGSMPHDAEGEKLESAFDADAAAPARRGRPLAHRSADERTFQSYEVFVFVTGEMRTFRMRHGIKRLPVKVRDAFIEFAKRMSPLADEEIVLEHLRKDQRSLPHYEEPTCFQVVRYEYEDGSVGNVVVAGPADGRL